MSIELDDLFGAIEDEVEALDAETPLDRHDRTRAVFLAAADAHRLVDSELSRYHIKLMNLVEWPGDRPSMHYSVRPMVEDLWRAGTLRFAANADPDTCAWVVAALTAYAPVKLALTDAQAEYNAALKALDLGRGFTEGAYVSFETRMGNDYPIGQGVIESVTATSYRVRIDHRNSSHQYRKQGHAKILIEDAMESVFYGGRAMKMLWGPAGDSARKAAQDDRDAAKRIDEVRLQAAFAAKHVDETAYEAALDVRRSHIDGRNAVERNAREAAIVMLTAAYAKQFESLIRAATLALEAELAGYEEPEILSGPDPRRRNVREWFPKEDT